MEGAWKFRGSFVNIKDWPTKAIGDTVASRVIFLFPPFRLDAANEQLWRDSNLVELRHKTFQVLLYLVQNAQRLVTKRELLDRVWAGTSVKIGRASCRERV